MATQCVTKVELTVSCEKLLDMDVGSKSDPLCVLHMNASGNQWFEVGRTEKIQNCLNPRFAKKFLIDYHFEIVQKLRFGIYDIDNKTVDLSDDDFLGELECSFVREASREYRRKQKEYVKSLENCIAEVENENKSLIQQSEHRTRTAVRISQLPGCSYSHSSQPPMSLADAEMLSTEEAAPPSVQAPNRSQTSATVDVSAEEASRRRELRLMQCREASREYCRKQKEYIKSLENRIADVEKNKTLIQQRPR